MVYLLVIITAYNMQHHKPLFKHFHAAGWHGECSMPVVRPK
jgi:hypothetical protein